MIGETSSCSVNLSRRGLLRQRRRGLEVPSQAMLLYAGDIWASSPRRRGPPALRRAVASCGLAWTDPRWGYKNDDWGGDLAVLMDQLDAIYRPGRV
jgi:hypothetical protein